MTKLANRFDTSHYLSPHSDLVALMVLEHQTETLNAMIKAGFTVRVAKHQLGSTSQTNKNELQLKATEYNQMLEIAANEIASVLLFKEETILSAPVKGTSEFATEFVTRGPFDAKGHTLREFDLQTRMFRYPVSYQIYSPTFLNLADDLKRNVIAIIEQSLLNEENSFISKKHASSIRLETLEILRHTFSKWMKK